MDQRRDEFGEIELVGQIAGAPPQRVGGALLLLRRLGAVAGERVGLRRLRVRVDDLAPEGVAGERPATGPRTRPVGGGGGGSGRAWFAMARRY